jgi:hypothetical protein
MVHRQGAHRGIAAVMTKPTKKLTCYQRGSRDLKIYRAQKARDKAYSEELSRERWRNYQADYAVTSAG